MSHVWRISVFATLALVCAHTAGGEFACAAGGERASECIARMLANHASLQQSRVELSPLNEDPADAIRVNPLRTTLLPRLPVIVTSRNASTQTLWFRLAVLQDILVWTNDANAGDSADAGLPVLKKADITPLLANSAALASRLDNATLRRRVQRETPVMRADVRYPEDILAGETVRFVVIADGIRVSGIGLALVDGELGMPMKISPRHARNPIVAVVTERP